MGTFSNNMYFVRKTSIILKVAITIVVLQTKTIKELHGGQNGRKIDYFTLIDYHYDVEF